jgi:anti-sigma factor RsiW
MNDTDSTDLQAQLRQLHADVLTQSVPERFTPAVDQLVLAHAQHAQRRQWWRWGGMAAGVALAFGTGWLAHAWQSGASPLLAKASPEKSFIHQAALAHAVYLPEVRHPVEVAAAQQEHLVQWLSKRLGKPLKVPNLSAQGFELVGGRLLPGDEGARAQFMFQNAGGERITLYVGAVNDKTNIETAFRYTEQGSTAGFYWVDHGFGYALSGQQPKATLLHLAQVVHQQL